jgi:hypothetical protein
MPHSRVVFGAGGDADPAAETAAVSAVDLKVVLGT